MICNISLFSRIVGSSNPVSLKYIFLLQILQTNFYIEETRCSKFFNILLEPISDTVERARYRAGRFKSWRIYFGLLSFGLIGRRSGTDSGNVIKFVAVLVRSGGEDWWNTMM